MAHEIATLEELVKRIVNAAHSAEAGFNFTSSWYLFRQELLSGDHKFPCVDEECEGIAPEPIQHEVKETDAEYRRCFSCSYWTPSRPLNNRWMGVCHRHEDTGIVNEFHALEACRYWRLRKRGEI